jgi:hypothetical protein
MIAQTDRDVFETCIAKLPKRILERPKWCPVKGEAVSEKGRCSNER